VAKIESSAFETKEAARNQGSELLCHPPYRSANTMTLFLNDYSCQIRLPQQRINAQGEDVRNTALTKLLEGGSNVTV
jgi:hypothetical protein